MHCTQWHAEGSANGATGRAFNEGRMQRVNLQNLHFIEALYLDDSSYCEATNTYSMNLKEICLRWHANLC